MLVIFFVAAFLSYSTFAAYGIELEMNSYIKVINLTGHVVQMSPTDDLCRVSPYWYLRTDDQSLEHRTFEFITAPLQHDDFRTRVSVLSSIRQSFERLANAFWRKSVHQKSPTKDLLHPFRTKISRASSYKALSEIMEECIYQQPEALGINTEGMVNWAVAGKPGFPKNISTVRYNIPAAFAFSQLTFGASPHKFYMIIRALTRVEGMGMAQLKRQHLIQIADDTFHRHSIADWSVRSILYIIMAHISSAQFCNMYGSYI
jgi:hypothetical protein